MLCLNVIYIPEKPWIVVFQETLTLPDRNVKSVSLH